jgi:hypothetical protein
MAWCGARFFAFCAVDKIKLSRLSYNCSSLPGANSSPRIKVQSGQATIQSNFREDVTVNGVINGTDVFAVKSKSGKALF